MDGMMPQRTIGDALAETMVRAMQDTEDRLDREMERLENLKEDDLDELRRKRLEQMKTRQEQSKELSGIGHGQYSEIFGEKDFFETCKKSRKVIVHFHRPTTWRCSVVDKHLEVLARKHIGTRFVKLNIEKCQFLAQRLRVYMLPTILLCKDGHTEHSIIGFDELGDTDEFTTEEMEELLEKWGMLGSSDAKFLTAATTEDALEEREKRAKAAKCRSAYNDIESED